MWLWVLSRGLSSSPHVGLACVPKRQSPQDGLVREGRGAQLSAGAWGGLELGAHCPEKRHCLRPPKAATRRESRHTDWRGTLGAPRGSTLGRGHPHCLPSLKNSLQPPATCTKQAWRGKLPSHSDTHGGLLLLGRGLTLGVHPPGAPEPLSPEPGAPLWLRPQQPQPRQ